MKNGKSGSKSVVISLDAELIWGFHDYETIDWNKVENARESWRYLIDLFDKYSVPATWGIVGHLFLDRCDGDHSDHPAGPDWFSRDSGGRKETEPLWFSPDLIEVILESEVKHELGSHSFSHIEFGNSKTTEAIASAEVERCCKLANEYNLNLQSFVFPRNKVGHRSVLAKHGFTSYRGTNPGRWYDNTTIRPLGKLATFTLGHPGPPIVTPEVDEYGLVNIPASLYLFSFNGQPKRVVEMISDDPIVRQVERGLKKLTQQDQGILHLWLHPNDIRSQEDRNRMEAVISAVSRYRDNQGINVETMNTISKKIIKE